MWTFFLTTFGCKVNQYESQALRDAWQTLGAKEVTSPDLADLICVNSCAVTMQGESDARQALLGLRRKAPKARIILTGCAAHHIATQAKNLALANVFIHQKNKFLLLENPWADSALVPLEQSNLVFGINSFQRSRPILKIQDGCNQSCTYCAIPQARGKSQSRDFEDIYQEALQLLQKGYLEIMLSGINLRQYLLQLPNKAQGDFWDLVEILDARLFAQFGKTKRLRLGSLDPSQLNPKAIEILAKTQIICPHLHIALQHSSSNVLKEMARGYYEAKTVAENLKNLRQIWQNMALGFDLIIGFPKEEESDLANLKEFLAEIEFSYAHVFPYSLRPETRAAKMLQIAPQIKQARAAQIRQIVNQKKLAFLQKQLALPQMYLALEQQNIDQQNIDQQNFEQQHIEQQNKAKFYKGINEFYVACLLEASDLTKADLADLRGQAQLATDLLPVKAVSMEGQKLKVVLSEKN